MLFTFIKVCGKIYAGGSWATYTNNIEGVFL